MPTGNVVVDSGNRHSAVSGGDVALFPTGTALAPASGFTSEASLGWYRSATSTMALSYGFLFLPKDANGVTVLILGAAGGNFAYANIDGIRIGGNDQNNTIWNSTRNISMVRDSGGTIFIGQTSSAITGFVVNTTTGASLLSGGVATLPSLGFVSEQSLGLYRSGVSTMALSYGTFNLATPGVRLSMRTIAASALTASAANTNVAVNEVVFTIQPSGASFAINSGGTTWIFNSDASAKNT